MEHEGEENAHGSRDREQDHEKMPDGVEVRPEAYHLHGEHTHEEGEHPDPHGPALEDSGDLLRRADTLYQGIKKAPPRAIPVAPLPALEGGDAEAEDHAQGDEIAEERIKPAAAKDDKKEQGHDKLVTQPFSRMDLFFRRAFHYLPPGECTIVFTALCVPGCTLHGLR